MMDMTADRPDPDQQPIAIGTIGGSGSRVLARILQGAGVSMGANLNVSNDNLDFTARFRLREILDLPAPQFAARLAEFEGLSRAAMQQAGLARWGWKEPNCHVVIDRILGAYPRLRYVHLLRNGRDMAFSSNRNQARLWGPVYLGRALDEPPGPRDMLAYFCEVHRRIAGLAARPENRDRMLFVHYEQLCARPQAEIARLLDFLDLDPGCPLADLVGLVEPAPGIGRHRDQGAEIFDPADLAYLAQTFPETEEPETDRSQKAG